MKKTSIMVLAILGIVSLIGTTTAYFKNTPQDNFLNEIQQFDMGMEKILNSNRGIEEKNMLSSKVLEIKDIMIEIHTFEQKKQPIDANEARYLAELYIEGLTKAIEFAKIVGDPVPPKEIEHTYRANVGEPRLVIKGKVRYWSVPVIKNGKVTAEISIFADTGEIESVTYK